MSIFVLTCPDCGGQDLDGLGFEQYECNDCHETFKLCEAEIQED